MHIPITIPIFNAGFGGYLNGSALWQTRQFVFDELALKDKFVLNELTSCELENYVFQCRTKHNRTVRYHARTSTYSRNMIIYLVGISCVGKTTIGKLLAGYIDFEFYDLDEQIEEYFERPIEYIQNEFITTNGFREKTSIVLNEILNKNRDIVIASNASGFRDHYLKQYKTTKRTKDIISINLTDNPENILNRLTFYDKNSIQIEKKLSINDRKEYLKEIKKDITFYKKFNLRADYSIDINGATPEVFLTKLIEFLIERENILMKSIAKQQDVNT